MIVLICAIFYTLLQDIAGAKAGQAAERPIARAE
jgi:hypothetical protein